jgi:hypothetical protein
MVSYLVTRLFFRVPESAAWESICWLQERFFALLIRLFSSQLWKAKHAAEADMVWALEMATTWQNHRSL